MKSPDIVSLERALQFYSHFKTSHRHGSVASLIAIHTYLFKGLFSYAGKIRQKDISKGGFRFASALYLPSTLEHIETMPMDNFTKIVEKYIEMNIAHPFIDGNGRATRLWLDAMLRAELSVCIDWHSIDKESYFTAMERSPVHDAALQTLLSAHVTHDINSPEITHKGVLQSYYYEGIMPNNFTN